MPETIPFRLSVDYDKKLLRMRVRNAAGKYVQANMNLEQIAEFMAILSHCQHALVHAHAGQKIDLRTFDPKSAFDPTAGAYRVGAYEGLPQFAVGIDDVLGLVALTLRGASDRLSGFRISADMAHRMGQALLEAVEKVPAPQAKQ